MTALRALPYLLALFFALWGLRDAGAGNIVDTDAARHAMNGAFLHDLVKQGDLARPAEYARAYYGRLPALSIPYHPPVFPLIESVVFFGFGVNLLAARLLVALAVAITAVLLYKLVLKTHSSHLLASLTTATFFWVNGSQRLAADVMLEFPTIALAIASLHVLHGLEPRLSMRRAVGFALLAGAALWTKQNVIFFGAIPFAYIILSRRWRLLAQPPVWVAGALFGAAVVGVTALQKLSPLAANNEWPKTTLLQTIAFNVRFYFNELNEEFGLIATVLMLAAVVMFALVPRTRNRLYAAWAAAGFALVIPLPPRDVRYLFFVYPAMVLLGYVLLYDVARRWLPERRAWAVPAAAAAIWIALVAYPVRVYLRGPSEAAKTVLAASPGRVLYCGRSNGSFIFTVRSLSPDLKTTVIRGDKLPDGVFTPEGVEAFAHDYGIEQIVLELNDAERRHWDELFAKPSPSMQLVREIPMVSSEPLLNGKLRVFRFTRPSPTPKHEVTLRMMNGSELKTGL